MDALARCWAQCAPALLTEPGASGASAPLGRPPEAFHSGTLKLLSLHVPAVVEFLFLFCNLIMLLPAI